MELDGDDDGGEKLGALADDVAPGRGVAVAGLAGDAACGRKLAGLERAAGVALGEPPAGLGDELAEEAVDELGDEGDVSPGVLLRALPPLAAARAAAASAGLAAPRTGAVALADGGGVAIVGPDEKAEPERVLLEDDEEGEAAGRAGLDEDAGRAGADDDAGRAGADEAAGRAAPEEACFDGLDGAAVGRPPVDPEADDDPEDDEGEDVGEAGVGEAAGRPAFDGVAGAGRDGAGAGREAVGAGRTGGAAGTAFFAAAGAAAWAAAPSGRTRVVSSFPPSLWAADVAFGDASVLIGIVPPPGICRDVLSDRWLLSELTCHLHAQAADEEPVDSARVPPSTGRQGQQEHPPVRPNTSVTSLAP